MKRFFIHILLLFLVLSSKGMTKADSIYKHPEVPAHYEGGIHKLGAYISDKMMENAEIYPGEHIHIVAMFTVEKNGELSIYTINKIKKDFDIDEIKSSLSKPKYSLILLKIIPANSFSMKTSSFFLSKFIV